MRFKRKTAFLGWRYSLPSSWCVRHTSFHRPARPPDFASDLRLIAIPQNHGSRILMRFTNSIWNAGPGSLEWLGNPYP